MTVGLERESEVSYLLTSALFPVTIVCRPMAWDLGSTSVEPEHLRWHTADRGRMIITARHLLYISLHQISNKLRRASLTRLDICSESSSNAEQKRCACVLRGLLYAKSKICVTPGDVVFTLFSSSCGLLS